MTLITYKGRADGRGTQYLVYDGDLKMQFVVAKDEEIEIPDEVYQLLKVRGDMAEGKLTVVEPRRIDLDAMKKGGGFRR